jgi:hypothetical protein
MHFTLIYTGELKANARPDHKHQLRRAFHSQLKVLWQQPPLVDHKQWYDNSKHPNKVNLNRVVGAFRFVPLVSPDLNLICELQISMLRPEPPGSLITQGGDIDNRLKTLFDALRIPKNEGELPKDATVALDEDPFFCLLEDDNLITSVSVKTDRLLTSPEEASQVHLDIVVETRPTKMISRKNGSRKWEISGGFALT